LIIACWSVKGGSGTTVVAAALALALRTERPEGVLLVDLDGDLPSALGMAEPGGPGIVQWLGATADLPADGLARLEVPVEEGLRLLPRGTGPWVEATKASSTSPQLLARALGSDDRLVVVDCGTLPVDTAAEVPLAVAACATQSLLVTRPCYLALRRAQRAPIRPSRIVVVAEPLRALSTPDVEAVLGVPVLVEVPNDPAIARAVDAGLLRSRLPRGLARVLRRAA
jgi:MinD-like ATPase involved in chromosome partitioning or flagellar assembly